MLVAVDKELDSNEMIERATEIGSHRLYLKPGELPVSFQLVYHFPREVLILLILSYVLAKSWCQIGAYPEPPCRSHSFWSFASNCTAAGISLRALQLVSFPWTLLDVSGTFLFFAQWTTSNRWPRSFYFLGLLAGGPAAIWYIRCPKIRSTSHRLSGLRTSSRSYSCWLRPQSSLKYALHYR